MLELRTRKCILRSFRGIHDVYLMTLIFEPKWLRPKRWISLINLGSFKIYVGSIISSSILMACQYDTVTNIHFADLLHNFVSMSVST